MCGISGFVDFSNGAPDPEILRTMADALRHRGPDDTGIATLGSCGLAHTRLAVLDVATSRQPMTAERPDCAMVFNGEIYNFQTLRAELVAQQVRFQTAGDTEVLLQLLVRQGVNCLEQLDGMFAFAFWRHDRGTLVLGRDPFGKKPLFYAIPRPDLLVFASEPKALFVHPEVRRDVDRQSLRHVLRFRAVYGDATMYADVRQLEPGAWLEYSRSGLRKGRYFDFGAEVECEMERQARCDDRTLEELGNRLLTEAVRKRLISDVPLGAFLSGGLDSSLIVSIMSQLSDGGPPVRTFSVGFANDERSELPYALQVADFLRTDHTEVHVTEGQFAEALAPLTSLRDAPLSEPADVAIAIMSRRAKQSVTVVLSGEGSDEAFAGYPKYWLVRTPAWCRRLFRAIGPNLFSRLAGLGGMDRRRAFIAGRALAARGELESLVQWFSYSERALLAQLFPGLTWDDDQWAATLAPARLAMGQAPSTSPIRRAQFVDFLNWLPGNLLARGDRMTMASGLELRCPFMDRRLAVYGLALPDRMKVRGRTLKHVVRAWSRDRLPPEILTRPKAGFRVPLRHWFSNGLRAYYNDLLRSPNGLCGTFGNAKQVERLLLNDRDAGIQTDELFRWTVFCAEIWYQSARQQYSSASSITGASMAGAS